jgi:hypothetical protein
VEDYTNKYKHRVTMRDRTLKADAGPHQDDALRSRSLTALERSQFLANR